MPRVDCDCAAARRCRLKQKSSDLVLISLLAHGLLEVTLICFVAASVLRNEGLVLLALHAVVRSKWQTAKLNAAE